MTRKEFSAKYDACMRYGSRQGWWIILLIVGLLAGIFSLSDLVRQRYGTDWANTAAVLMMLAVMAAFFVGVVLLNARLSRKFGLLCPGCGRLFTDKLTHWKILLTGHCPKCQAKVFEDEAIDGTTSGRSMDRDEFKAKWESFNHQSKRGLIFYFSAMVACVLVGGYLERLVDHGGLDWVTLAEWKWFAWSALGAVSLAVAAIFYFAFKGKFDFRSLPCPECGRSLVRVGRTALERGICVYCGCRLFEAPSSEA